MSEAVTLNRIIEAMHDPACYPHAVNPVRHIETHISHLLLTGSFAYKIKKPLNLGFLDFSTLDKRRFCCEEELRLNRRLAPDVYLEVVSINGQPGSPRINGAGPVLEYAVKMRQFDPASGLDQLEEQGRLTSQHADAMAETVADFHARIPPVPQDSEWGRAETIWQPVTQNFQQIAARLGNDDEARTLLGAISQWSETEHARLRTDFEQRRVQGFVRECHGDLHLANMAWENDRLLIFDCIEFNPALRWIDVISEVAFCYMDLLNREHPDFASRFLNCYLERTGDYAGMKLLRFYAVYRAMVRAKVASIRSGQSGQSAVDTAREKQECLDYLRLALKLSRSDAPSLVIAHGLSGSGKTTFSQELVAQLGMITLRSDIERKRLAGLDALAKSGSGVESGIYTRDFSRRTYEYMAQLAESLLQSGWRVLVDATFIARWQRNLFRQLASRCSAAFHILDFNVPENELRQRVRARSATGRDASEADVAVLENQLKTCEPLTADELERVIPAVTVESVATQLKAEGSNPPGSAG